MTIYSKVKSKIKDVIYPSLATPALRKNHRHLSELKKEQVREALRKYYFNQPINYFAATPEEYLDRSDGTQDMFNHVDWRTDFDRSFVIPWLASVFSLPGCRILEIGCGTGASTVTLAEQGCDVTAIDVNPGNLCAARERCRIYGLEAQFLCHNATELKDVFPSGSFDLVMFFATLEHLTYPERLIAMKSTWEMQRAGGLWCVVDTPNRLWWFDNHTAFLPFYHWLPDDLAIDYAPHCDRVFMKAYGSANRDDATRLDFARRGRGVSYHEFDLTLGESMSLDVISAMDVYVRDSSLVMRAKWLLSQDSRYEKMLRSLGPKIHRGFYQPYLNIILRKH